MKKDREIIKRNLYDLLKKSFVAENEINEIY